MFVNSWSTYAVAGVLMSIAAPCLAGFSVGGSGRADSTTIQDSTTVLPAVSGGLDASTLSSALGTALSTLTFANSGGTVTGSIGAFGSPAPDSVTYSSNTPSVCTTSGATVTALALGTCSVTATVAKDEYYNAGTLTETFEITAVNQDAVTLNNITWATSGTASFPGVSGGSGTGAVTYASTGVCTVTTTGFTASGPGTCDITVTKAASGLFAAITSTETVTVAAVDQASVSFDLSGTSFTGTSTTVTLPSASGGSGSGSFSYAVASGPCTVSGSTLTATGIGTCSVTATKAGSGLYGDESSSDSITFNGIDPTSLVSFGTLPSFSKSNPTQNAPTVSLTTGQTYSTSVAPASVCSISGSSITATGNGNCVMTVSLEASGIYQAATVSTGNMASTAGAYVYSGCTARRGYAICSGGKHRVPRSKRVQAGCNSIPLNLVARCSHWSGSCSAANVTTEIVFDDTSRVSRFTLQSTWDTWNNGSRTYGDLDSYWTTNNTAVHDSSYYIGNDIAAMCANRS